MKETLGTIWTGTYGIVGAVCMYAHDVVAKVVTHVLADSTTFTHEAQAWISFASAAGGFVIVVLSIWSLSLKIQQQKQSLRREPTAESVVD